MIGSLRGEIIDKEEGGVVIEVGGVGFYVLGPTTLLDILEVGVKTQLFTHLHVREQELTLFGFVDTEELELFRTLLKVQGIGPKVALAILSHIPVETLRQAIAREEAALLAFGTPPTIVDLCPSAVRVSPPPDRPDAFNSENSCRSWLNRKHWQEHARCDCLFWGGDARGGPVGPRQRPAFGGSG